MKHLKRFKNNNDYQSFLGDMEEYTEPHVVTIENSGTSANVLYKARPQLITFQVSGSKIINETKTYIAENGMTFRQFCNSSYNIDGWVVYYNPEINREYVMHQYDDCVYLNGNSIRPDIVINPLDVYGWIL